MSIAPGVSPELRIFSRASRLSQIEMIRQADASKIVAKFPFYGFHSVLPCQLSVSTI